MFVNLTGMKFRQRVEAVIEKFNDMREDLDRDRKFMGKQLERGADPGGCRLYGRNGGRPAGHRRQGYARDSQPRHAVARTTLDKRACVGYTKQNGKDLKRSLLPVWCPSRR